MIKKNKTIVFDVDGTICEIDSSKKYIDLNPIDSMVQKIRELKQDGFTIILQTARNMKTYEGNIGLINANTLIELNDWLKKHDIPFDEIHVGKPWCGVNGFYVDDKAIRPNEFLNNSIEELNKILEHDANILKNKS